MLPILHSFIDWNKKAFTRSSNIILMHILLLHRLWIVISHSSILHKILSISADQKNSIIADQISQSALSKTIHKLLLWNILRIIFYLTWTQNFTTFIAAAFPAMQQEFHFLFFLVYLIFRFLSIFAAYLSKMYDPSIHQCLPLIAKQHQTLLFSIFSIFQWIFKKSIYSNFLAFLITYL